MLYPACTTISSVDRAQYGVSLAKDWVSVECGTKPNNSASVAMRSGRPGITRNFHCLIGKGITKRVPES